MIEKNQLNVVCIVVNDQVVKSGKVWEMPGFTTGVERMLHLHKNPPRSDLE